MKTFRDLIVWQKSMGLVTQIYVLTKFFPDEEKFGLTSQIRRCSISIPSNIAEGYGRNSTNDYLRFLQISLGSLFELFTQLEISKNLNYIQEKEHSEINNICLEIERMLTSLISKIKN